MKPNNIYKRYLMIAMALATAFVLAAALPCTAKAAGPTECGLIGTWAGNAGSDMYWMGVHTAGSTSTKGEMLLDWVSVSSSLLSGATRLAPARGVWEQTTKGHYNYTWYTYGIDAAGDPIYTVRVSGTAETDGCDTIDIQYNYEICDPTWPPQDVSEEDCGSITGSAHEYRIPVTVVTPAP